MVYSGSLFASRVARAHRRDGGTWHNEHLSDAETIIARCRELAKISDSGEGTCRTFLSPAMRRCYDAVATWMRAAGMRVRVDNAGNLLGTYSGDGSCSRPLLLGSHLDTVPNAGAFDGILGVVLAIQLVQNLGSRKLPFDISVVGFSEEEGVRFGIPFIGSHALAGTLNEAVLARTDAAGKTVADAISEFSLHPEMATKASLKPPPLAYLEFHIEQGPVLDHACESLAVVEAVAGQTRALVTFTGHANHAGTTPVNLRSDALCGAAEWISAVEQQALSSEGLMATVGKIEVTPGITNVVPGEATMTLDCRHASDVQRTASVEALRIQAKRIADRRRLAFRWVEVSSQASTLMDAGLVDALQSAAKRCGLALRRMASGAGHDAMIMAPQMPSVMLFLRSPGGISHHPAEAVLPEDVANAMLVGSNFIEYLGSSYRQWELS